MREQVRESVWHHEVKRVLWILINDLKNRQQVLYWSKAADNTETFPFFHLSRRLIKNQGKESEKILPENM
jgi:hypothetical protein